MSGRIIRASELSLHETARDVLQRAEASAAAITNSARRGAQADRARLLRETHEAAERTRAMLLAKTAAKAQAVLDGLYEDVAEAMTRAIARILGELDLGETVARAASVALSEVSIRHGLILHVHPTAAAQLRAVLGTEGDRIRIVLDETLASDSCTIETEAGIVRAGVSDQLAAIRQAFLEVARAADADIDA
jgi:type III secretion system HrpE/YscL family protein